MEEAERNDTLHTKMQYQRLSLRKTRGGPSFQVESASVAWSGVDEERIGGEHNSEPASNIFIEEGGQRLNPETNNGGSPFRQAKTTPRERGKGGSATPENPI